MAPAPHTLPENEEEFLNNLAAYHEQRGTTFDRDPKVAGRPISLIRLYRKVMEEGGYDHLSAERMRWRALTKVFGLGNHHEAAMTFQLKTVYYKNLAAYEISKYWGLQPPPPDILENLTAKGGDLRNRTRENYTTAISRDPAVMADGVDSAEEELRTPRADTMDVEEPGSSGRYPTRQLRQDPKRTQIYQPDIGASRPRYPRATSSPQSSPAPAHQHYLNTSADPRNHTFNLEKYEPRQPVALTLRPVITPGNNHDLFWQRQAAAMAQKMPKPPQYEPQQLLKPVLGPSMSGPNIYIRCLYGLRSPLPEEQDFALHHLVKVSYERGDKYKFEGFPLLAETLLEKALEITVLIYDVKLEVSYEDDENVSRENVLNGSYGTPDILDRVRAMQVKILDEGIETADFAHKLDKLNEAALVVRNMVILEENAAFISRFPLLREFLIIAIHLPHQSRLAEFQHYALEIAEQVTRYWELPSDDPLYISLLNELTREDRGAILSAMRAIIRIGMDRPYANRLTNIPLPTVERLFSFLYLESDDELISTCLDFLYQYTAQAENLNILLAARPALLPNLTPRLASLLLHGARPHEEKYLVQPAVKLPPNTTIPPMPNDLFQQILSFPQAQRSSQWLKCCFEESPQDDITQIAIWQAYQARFASHNPIPAADFIKNVSNTFATAQAQVIPGHQPRFIIKGIRPKRTLTGLNGEAYLKCLWETSTSQDNPHRHSSKHLCGQWNSTRESLWLHLMADHLNIPRTADGAKFDAKASGSWMCYWSGCTKYITPTTDAYAVGIHVRIHVPNLPAPVPADSSTKQSDILHEAEYIRHMFYNTPVDDKGLPTGISWMAVMVLRNLARYANRHPNPHTDDDKEGEFCSTGTLIDQLFGHVRKDIFNVWSINKTMAYYVYDLLNMIGHEDMVAVVNGGGGVDGGIGIGSGVVDYAFAGTGGTDIAAGGDSGHAAVDMT